MKKIYTQTLVFLGLLISSLQAYSQTFVKCPDPPGLIIHKIVDGNTLSIITKSSYTGTHYVIYQYNAGSNFWDSITSFKTVGTDKYSNDDSQFHNIINHTTHLSDFSFVRLHGNYYLSGLFDSVTNLGGGYPATVLAYENNQWKKINARETHFPSWKHVYMHSESYETTVASGDTIYSLVYLSDTNFFDYTYRENNAFKKVVLLKYYNGQIGDTITLPKAYYHLRSIPGGVGLIRSDYPTNQHIFYECRGRNLTAIGFAGTVAVTYNGVTQNKNVSREHIFYSNETQAYYAYYEGGGVCVWSGGHWQALRTQAGSIASTFPTFYENDMVCLGKKNPKEAFLMVFRNNKWQVLSSGLPEPPTPSHWGFLDQNGMLEVFRVGNNLFYFAKRGDVWTEYFSLYKLNDRLARVSGYVYHDVNNSCTKDAGEKVYANAVLRLSPGNIMVNTDDSGHYSVFLDSGSYTAMLISKKHHQTTCATGPISVSPGDRINGLNLAQEPIPGKKDLSVSLSSLTGFRARRGATVYYSLDIQNAGTATVTPSSLILRYDQRSVNFNTSSSYTRIDSSTIEFPLDSIQTETSKKISFSLDASHVNYQSGNKFTLSARIINTYNDVDTSDNRDTLHQEIVTSLDPNEKQCYPGVVIQPFQKIKYLIHFQNLGTDSAVNIRVDDTLSQRLPVEKLIIHSASHPYKVLIKNNVISWVFEKIMLPPASVSYEKSQGYISFTAEVNGAVNIGDTIRNKAYIYFDYEDAVITNTAHAGLRGCTDNVKTLGAFSLPDASVCKGDSVLIQGPADRISYAWSNGAYSRDIRVSSPGTYILYAVDTNACQHSDTMTFDTLPLPVPNLQGDKVVCKGSTVTLVTNSGYSSYHWNTGAVTNQVSVSSGGTYRVTVTDNMGCTATDSIHITADSVQKSSLIFSRTAIGNRHFEFTPAVTGGIDHYWTFGDGENSASGNPSHQYTSAGTYKVCHRVTNTNGCTDSICETFNVTSVSKLPGDVLAIGVYPNPFHDGIWVSLNLEKPASVSISLYDMLGREYAVTSNETAAAGKFTKAVNSEELHLPAGVFTLKVTVNGADTCLKLVKAD